MYSLRFSKTYNFSIMENNCLNHVIEDKFIAENNMFCVADGVTRDFPDDTPLTYPTTLDDALRIVKNYQNPSGAAKAAQVCVDTVISYFQNIKCVSQNALYRSLKLANSKIRDLNKDRKINYLSEDYFNCVAVGGVITENSLYCFSIGDSEIKVIDKDFNTIFDSSLTSKEDPGIFYTLMEKLMPNTWKWENNICRKYFRKHIRNNLWLKYTGRFNVGSLTGQKKALKFIDTFQIPLENAQYILAFSDGCAELLETKEQIRNVINNPESIKNSACEKTLLIYEKI